MKIGVLTYSHHKQNYGQILQAYALVTYLRNMGHEAFLIRYDLWWNRKFINGVSVNELDAEAAPEKVGVRQHKLSVNYLMFETMRDFPSFIRDEIPKTLQYMWFEELQNNPPEADIYMVGSDQIWKTDGLQSFKNARAFFLDFGSSQVRRMAYAASFGMDRLNAEYREFIKPLLSRFDTITVREKMALSLLQDCGVKGQWVCDPTLLLTGDEYRQLYANHVDESKMPQKPYVFFYSINEQDIGGMNPLSTIRQFANSVNCDLQYTILLKRDLTESEFTSQMFPTIYEWLWLIDHAEYVICDSFHGSVFSVIFGKKFGTLKLQNPGQRSRLDGLFEAFQIGDRFVTPDDFSNALKPYQPIFSFAEQSREILRQMLQ